MDRHGRIRYSCGSGVSPVKASASLIDSPEYGSPVVRSRVGTGTSHVSHHSFASSDRSTDTLRPEDTFYNNNGPSDIPLDAFDKELLTSGEEAPKLTEHRPVGFYLPKQALTAAEISSRHRKATKDDLYGASRTTNPPCPSTGENISSPTAAALESGRRQKSRRASCSPSKPNEASISSEKESLLPAIVSRCANQYPTPAPPKSIQLDHAPPIVQGIPLVSVANLPDRFRSLFPFPVFNAVQSKCFATAFKGDQNLVLSAPTGSGKTVVMELAICHLKLSSPNEQFKIVYQSPTKALCRERCNDWQAKFSSLDLKCAELTGDTDVSQMRNVQAAQIIVTTPEKWDSITRRWKDHAKLMHLVKLFLIDEVHILKESRGATLEAVVSRMKSSGSGVRFVALSATIPNSEDVAQWLGKDFNRPNIPAHREEFGEEFRPVRLQKAVYGFPVKANEFVFDSILESKLPEIIAKHSRGKPVLIFCPFRRSCLKTAKSLAQLFISTAPSHRLWAGPKRAPGILDHDLRQLVSAGVAFHHAGLDLFDRQAVEQGFLSQDINIICCTSTLAVGVNLPCYLAIVKGTTAWTENGSQEYADLEIMQMLGRAGRPQYEQSACAVILTRQQRVEYYENLVCGRESLESCLHLNLIDHLNAEIGLGTVTDVHSARCWLASTFLSVRLRRNPDHYRLKENVTPGQDEDVLSQICAKDVTLLREAELVTQEGTLKCTEFGDAMARYYVKFDTMKILLSLPPKAKLSEILSAFAQSGEFRDLRLKSGEKTLYKHLNKDVGMKFPIKVDLALQAHKVSLLVQSELGGVEFPVGEQFAKHKSQFHQDRAMVFQHTNRLIRCIIDCQLSRGDSVSARHALELARSFAARVWENSPLQLKQLDQIGNVAVRKLANAGINSIELLENTEAHRLESVIGRGPPFGMKLLSKLSQFPKLRVLVKLVGKELSPADHVKVMVKSEIGFFNESVPMFFRKRPVYVCFLAETSDGTIIDFRRISASRLKTPQEVLLSVVLTKPCQYIACHVMCDEIAATSKSAELKLHLPPSLFLKSTGRKDADKGGDPTKECQPNQQLQNISRKRKHSDIFDESGLDEMDWLAAENVEIMDVDDFQDGLKPLLQEEAALNNRSRASISNQLTEDESSRDRQLENGKWACNHKCKDKEKCKHLCCRDGLDKPPKPPKKTTHGASNSRASISSMLETIDRRTPADVPLASTEANYIQDDTSSWPTFQKQRPWPPYIAKEAKSLSKFHQATISLPPSDKSRSATSQREAGNIGSSGTALASSNTAWTALNLDGEEVNSERLNATDMEDDEGPVSLKAGIEGSGGANATVPTNLDQVPDDLVSGDMSDLEDIANVLPTKGTSYLKKPIPLSGAAVAGQQQEASDSKRSLSSQTIRESSPSDSGFLEGKDPFHVDDDIHDFLQPDLDWHATGNCRFGSPSGKVGAEQAATEVLDHGSSISPAKKLFFTSPERGQDGLSDGVMTAKVDSQSRTARDGCPSAGGDFRSCEATPNSVVVSAPQLGSALSSRPGSEVEGKHSKDMVTSDEQGFSVPKRNEEEQRQQQQQYQLLIGGIEPSFYDEFKDIIEFV